MGEHVGRILEICRFPVKSMAGELCASAEVDWQGIEGDRQYGFVRRGNASRFPWFTGRDHSDLVRYRPTYDDARRPRTSKLSVIDPGGRSWRLDDPALREQLEAESGRDLDLLQLGIGAYDLMPISIVTTGSLDRLADRHGSVLDRRRLRTNIVIESSIGDKALQGKHLQFGGQDGAALLLAYSAPRCAMVTIDPETGQTDPRVLRTIAQHFGNAFTTYASVARPGILRVGDIVEVLAESAQ